MTSERQRPIGSTGADDAADRVHASPFFDLGLDVRIVRALVEEGYAEPSPVQVEVIPAALDGRDVLACAQTGTGKTAAFVTPILQHLSADTRAQKIRGLVLTPTRELAAQIGDRIRAYGTHLQLKWTVIYGGVSQMHQETALRRRPDILVATPGRLLDLLGQKLVDLSGVTHLVLDEADRMLDMGFIHDVRRVLAYVPKKRQTLFFSATIPSAVADLANGMLVDPAKVSVTPLLTTAEKIDHSVVFVERNDKRSVLEHVLKDAGVTRAIVFTRTKHGANRLSEQLGRSGIVAAAIHGNKSQGARERALSSFKEGTTRVLVATDLAARGIDVDGVSHVINYELPNVPESYVHRIGRTGRAGAAGVAISLCDGEERALLRDIERFIKACIPTNDLGGRVASSAPPAAEPQAPRQAFGANPGNTSRNRRFPRRSSSTSHRIDR
ncbi:MAG: DEAD/DEAH box helicase [Polyangiaceae bacterium]|nr:DEAD/DEAH box helicase [Polyangiaceae bacterium]